VAFIAWAVGSAISSYVPSFLVDPNTSHCRLGGCGIALRRPRYRARNSDTRLWRDSRRRADHRRESSSAGGAGGVQPALTALPSYRGFCWWRLACLVSLPALIAKHGTPPWECPQNRPLITPGRYGIQLPSALVGGHEAEPLVEAASVRAGLVGGELEQVTAPLAGPGDGSLEEGAPEPERAARGGASCPRGRPRSRVPRRSGGRPGGSCRW